MSRTHHLVIAGTGRAGTTFLVEYLAACGLDVGEPDMAYYERARAGLERSLLGDRTAYVVKDPWFHEIAPLLPLDEVTIDAVVVPVRNLRDAAASRLRNEVADLVEQGFPPGRSSMGRVPGGVIYPLDLDTQMRTLALGQAVLLQWCVEHSIDVCFLSYPRIVEDHDYLYERMARFLPPSLGAAESRAAFERVRRPPTAPPDGPATSTADSHDAAAPIWELELARLERDRWSARSEELERQLADMSTVLEAARGSLALAMQRLHEEQTTRPLEMATVAAELRRLERAVAEFEASEAYRVGRAVTWPARHAKQLLRTTRLMGRRRS